MLRRIAILAAVLFAAACASATAPTSSCGGGMSMGSDSRC